MELRRALLLFAIVLGLAAIASSIARPPERDGEDAQRAVDGDGRVGPDSGSTAPSAAPRPGTPDAEPLTIRFRSEDKPRVRELEQGRPGTVLVEVEKPAQVEIPSLGLTQSAEPLTPARFDVLVPAPGDHRIVLHPAAAEASSIPVGMLTVVAGS